MTDRLEEIEIMVRMIIPRAVSKADLEEYYGNDPLRCAKELIESGGLLGATNESFEVVSAKTRKA